MLFNPRESIDFNGNTGPFIQYTYARIRSVLRKAAEMGMTTSFDGRVELIAEEVELVKYLADFPQTVLQAGASYSPSIIGAYVYDLAKMYNSYYHDHSILREEREDVRQFRVALSSVVAATIGYGMSLMGIEVPERM